MSDNNQIYKLKVKTNTSIRQINCTRGTVVVPGLSIGQVEVGALVDGPKLRVRVPDGCDEVGLVVNPLEMLTGSVSYN